MSFATFQECLCAEVQGSKARGGPGCHVVPAGRPQPHISVFLLNPGSMELSQGEGEVCFGGIMASGYWQQPELTAAAFVEHPELGRLYRTGDLGMWHGQQLVVHGRLDRQVKIRGCRVELEEIEVALAALWKPRASHVAVVAAQGPEDRLQVVAFVCPADLETEALQADAKQRLLPQLVPSLFVVLPALPRLASGKVDLVGLKASAARALFQQSQETSASLDSLGLLQHLTKTQLEEQKWLQNQQAFWLLLVMIQHFCFVHGASFGQVKSPEDGGWLAEQAIALLGRNKDMIAFTLLLGFSDASYSPSLGARDAVVLITAALMTLVLNPLADYLSEGDPSPCIKADWFLYTYLWARLVLCSLCHLKPGLWQPVLLLSCACLIPDDLLWLQLPMAWRASLSHFNVVFRTKGLRFVLFFMPGCYLLAWNATRLGLVAWCRRVGTWSLRRASDCLANYIDADVAQQSLERSVCFACAAFFLAISALSSTGPQLKLALGYQQGYQAVYVEGGFEYSAFEKSSHSVTWQYMTHPSLAQYVALWLEEFLLLVLPTLAVAVAMAYVPWHFKRIGGTCFGTYVLHVEMWSLPFIRIFDEPVVSHISWVGNPWLNAAIVLLWNIAFCLAFAYTLGAGFHDLLVSLLRSSLNAIMAKCSPTETTRAEQV